MYNLNQVMRGVQKYLENEIVAQIGGWQKWLVGAGISTALSRSTAIFNQLKSNEIVKSLGIIDNEDNIDVETLYKEIKKQADKSAVTFQAPIIGNLTLKSSDVDKLYNYIKE